MFTSEIKRVSNDETVTNTSTATFEVIFAGLDHLHPFGPKTLRKDDAAYCSIVVCRYEVTRHGEDGTTFSIISSQSSPVDTKRLCFLIEATSQVLKVTRMLIEFTDASLEYLVGRVSYSFINASAAELARLPPKVLKKCELEAIEAFKVGVFINELEKLGSWDAIGIAKEDDPNEWVEIAEPSGHEKEACNGLGMVEVTKRGI